MDALARLLIVVAVLALAVWSDIERPFTGTLRDIVHRLLFLSQVVRLTLDWLPPRDPPRP
jgi:hypothetical protein